MSLSYVSRIVVLPIAFGLIAAACGSDDDSSSSADDSMVAQSAGSEFTAEPASSIGADTADGAFPVSVEHALGTTLIDTEPQRVVTVGVTEHDTVLAVGMTPVGVTEWYGDQPDATWPWAQDELGDAEPVVLHTTDGLEYERIVALEPDLIIGTNAGLDPQQYEQLSQIAPTIAHPTGAPLYFSPWDDQARLIGQALGKVDEMDVVIADIDAQFAAAAAAHPEFEGTRIVFLQNAFYDGSAIAYQEGLSTEFLTDLGFIIPSEIDEFATEGQAYIPLERLDVLDTGDVLLWATEAPDDRTALEDEPLYNALEAVQDGQLVFTDGVTAGAIYFTSPLSLPFVLEQLVPALASTIAGEGPATIDSTS
jgi:iron complex transport system substrate-binding protein